MKRNFLLTLLLTLLPFVGWADVTFRFPTSGASTDLPNPYYVATAAEADFTVSVYLNGQSVNDWVWQKKDGDTWTTIYDDVNGVGSSIDAGKVTGPGLYKASGFGAEGTFEVIVGTEPTTGATETFLVVNPQTTCVMTWGLPFELGVNDIIVTPNKSDEVKKEILKIIKINQDLSSQDQSIGPREFTIGLIDNKVRTVTVDETTYTIQATGTGEINIQKGNNKLVTGWENSVTLAQNLVFNGLSQNLLVAADYTFTSWSAREEGDQWGLGQVRVVGEVKEPAVGPEEGEITFTGIKVLTNAAPDGASQAAQDAAAAFVGKTFYVIGTASNLPTGRLQLYAYEKVNDEDKLVAQPIWVEVKNTQLTTYAGAYEFFSISKAEYEQKFKDAAIAAYATANNKTVTELTDAEKATAVQGLQIPEPEAYVFGTENPVLTETWVKEGELPTGINAGKYYVWVRATEGSDKYSADETIKFVGKPEIAKAKPTFTGTIAVKETYYIFTDQGNKNNLKEEIKPTVDLKAHVGSPIFTYNQDVTADDVVFYVQKGTLNQDGKTYTYAFDPQTTTETARRLANYQFTEGRYRIIANSKTGDNLLSAPVSKVNEDNQLERIAAEFDVMKPSVAIQTLVKGEASANYGYGVKPQAKDYDWKVAGWTGYTGNENIKNADIAVSYTWYDANDQEVNPATSDLPVGIYTVVADGPFGTAAGTDFGYVVEPATVYIGETNILAAVEDQTLVFGQELPLKLKYSQGAFTPNTETGAAQIKKFENTMWATGFKAKMIKDANGDAVEDAEEIKLYSVPVYHTYTPAYGPNRVRNDYYRTTILPVGTYTVSADVAYADNKNYKIAAAAGTWTVTAKDINNEDFGNWQDPYDRYDTPEPRVKGMGGTFSLNKTYTSKEITFGLRDLAGKFTYRDGDFDFSNLPFGSRPTETEPVGDGDEVVEETVYPDEIQAIIDEIKETGKATDAQILALLDFFMPIVKEKLDPKGLYYGSLLLGKDFEITSYTNNINAGTATFHVKGIGNFTGEKDLTFTIDKALIFVFPDKYDGVNKWAVGSPQEDAFQVDWEGKDKVNVVYKKKTYNVPTGIKYQLHAFENDRPLVNPEIVNSNGFKDLKVKFIVGATVGEHPEGLKAYAENNEEADNYEFVFQTAPLTIEQGTIVLAVETIDANHNKAVTYSGTRRPRAKDAAGTFTLAPADKQVQELDPALQQQWWKVKSDKKENGDPWTITWEDNLDDPELKQEIAGSDPKEYRYPASDALPEGKSYKIKCKGFEDGVTFSSTNYKFILAEGADEAPLTVKRADATISVWAGDDAPEPTNEIHKNYNDFIVAAANNHTTAENEKAAWMATIGQIKDEDGNITGNSYVKIEGKQDGDVFTDLVASVDVNDDNEIIITAVDNKNYNIDPVDGIVNGTLVIDPVEGTLALNSNPVEYYTDEYGDYTDETGHDLPVGSDPVVKNPYTGNNEDKAADLFVLQAYDKVPVEAVTIKLKAATLDPENEAYSEWKAGQWHTMVLPFATTVGEIAYNFKYAIVNVVDVNATNAATKPNEVHFMLQEIMDEIPANTPFMIKSQYDFDYDKTLLYFGNVEGALAKKLGDTNPIYIEYDAKPSVEAGKTYTFEGTYDQMVIDKNTLSYKFIGPDNRWKQFSETSTSKYTLQPYAGYLNLQGLTGTREVVCFFEEEDGSTTAINAAELQNVKSAEGLYRVDGIKLQSAPTQKGVYIQNGKKFVK